MTPVASVGFNPSKNWQKSPDTYCPTLILQATPLVTYLFSIKNFLVQ